MKRLVLTFSLILLTTLSEGFNHDAAAIDQKTACLVVAGSGTCIPIATKLAEAFNQKTVTKITIPESIGSSGAIQAVKAGSLSMGLTSRPLKNSEKNAGLTEIPFAKVGVIFGVHPDVPDINLTVADLVAIIKGDKTKWRNGKTIIVLTRDAGDSTIDLLKKKVPGFSAAYDAAMTEKRWVTCFTDYEEAKAIAQTPNSFGFSDTATLSTTNAKIKALRFTAIEPTLTNLRNSKYPFTKSLYFIYKGSAPAAAEAFINFVKSPQGQKILRINGALPTED